MGTTKQLTITRQIHNKNLPGYNGYNLYLAREAVPSPYGMAGGGDVYLLTQNHYANTHSLWLDLDQDTEPLANSTTGKIDGYRVYVQVPKTVVPEGHFRVKRMVPATGPVDEFKKNSIDRSKFNLYETTHHLPNGQKGSLSRVFSEVTFFRGEDIPGNETILLRKIAQNDGYDYYLHSKAMFSQRAAGQLTKG